MAEYDEKEVRIRNIIDTEQNWLLYNPVLLRGEVGFAIKTGNQIAYKIGDGNTAWANLPYSINTASEITAMVNNLQNQIDAIVTTSASGGDVAAEVAQSRVGADGTAYQTLKQRLDAEYNTLTVEQTNLKEDLSQIVTPVFDTVVLSEHTSYFTEVYTGGSYDENGNWVQGGYYTNIKLDAANYHYEIGIDANVELYVQLCIFNGTISPDNFVKRLRTTDGNLPTSARKITISAGQTVVITRAMGSAVQYCNIITNWKNDDYNFTESAQNKIKSAVEVDTIYESIEAVDNKITTAENNLTDRIDKIAIEMYDIVGINDASTYYSNYYSGGYYDASGNWVASGSYQNMQMNSKPYAYEVGVENNSELYVQICVFNGEIKPENFVARYRTNDNNLPSYENMLSVEAGQTVVITRAMGDKVQYCNVKTNWKYGNYEFTDTAKQKISEIYKQQNKPLLRYVPVGGNDSSIEAIDIYYPIKNGYLMYNFVHSVNAEVKSNIWRLSKVFTCNDSLAVVESLTDTAEWECAIKLNGRSDFAGGVIHGDEIMEDVVFIADGKPIDIHNYVSAQYFDNLIVVQKSKLYDPSNEEIAFAEHTSEHIFADGKMIINQTVKFLDVYTLGTSYIAMYPPLKTVTNKYYTDKDFAPKTIDLSNNVTINGVRETCLYGDNYFSKFISHKYPQYVSGDYLLMTDNNGRSYNKCYYVACGNNQAVESGELWQSSIEYEIISQLN